jgi:hypothetical protein
MVVGLEGFEPPTHGLRNLFPGTVTGFLHFSSQVRQKRLFRNGTLLKSVCQILSLGFLHVAMAISKQRQLRQFRIAGQAEREQKCSRVKRNPFGTIAISPGMACANPPVARRSSLARSARNNGMALGKTLSPGFGRGWGRRLTG